MKAGEVLDAEAGRGIRSHKLPKPAIEPDSVVDKRGDDGIRRGRPRIENQSQTREALKPWEAAGMSRATFYRRLREARDGRIQD